MLVRSWMLVFGLGCSLGACGDDAAQTSDDAGVGDGDSGDGDSGDGDSGDGDSGDGDDAPTTPEIESIQVTVGELTFDVRVAGPEDGEPVMLLHGFPQTSYEWRHQLVALAEAGYRAVAPDQRGYSPGARPEKVDDYAATLLMNDALGIADELGMERFHVVGHDWGASVAWIMGAFASARVITLNTISVPHLDAFAMVRNDPDSCQSEASSYFDVFIQPDSEDMFLRNDAAGLRGFYEGIPEEDVDVYVEALGSKAALGAALNWYRANLAGDGPGTMIGKIHVPTMYVWSDGDTALCIDGALLTEDFVDGPYRFETIKGVNHWVPDLAPDKLGALLLDHLSDHPAE